eukprot:1158973-Pelagomonas_calceolata.AAC.9
MRSARKRTVSGQSQKVCLERALHKDNGGGALEIRTGDGQLGMVFSECMHTKGTGKVSHECATRD